MNFCFLVVLAVSLIVVRADPVHVSMDLHCEDSRLPWCGDVFIYEADFDTTHDILKTEHFCTNQTEQKFQWTFWPGGDLSRHYELAYQLNHDCTSDGYVRCIKPEPLRVKVHGTSKTKFIANVKDVGTKPGCPPMY